MKILIIEDHPIYRDGLAGLVAQLFAEAQVEQTSDAGMALEQLLQNDTFDLVLLDLKMPGLDGSIALTVLRSRHPAVPVVGVSADEDAGTIRACIDAGASGYIPKSGRGEILSAGLAIGADPGLYPPPTWPIQIVVCARSCARAIAPSSAARWKKRSPRRWSAASKQFCSSTGAARPRLSFAATVGMCHLPALRPAADLPPGQHDAGVPSLRPT